MGVTYDAGALVSADLNRRSFMVLHRQVLARGLRPTVPAGVLAQVWRGGPQAELSRVLKGCRIEHLDERLARAAGETCGRSGTSDIVDAAVVVSAIARNDIVFSSDRGDLTRIADALGVSVEIEDV